MEMSFDDCHVTGGRPGETWRSEVAAKSLPDADAALGEPDLNPARPLCLSGLGFPAKCPRCLICPLPKDRCSEEETVYPYSVL